MTSFAFKLADKASKTTSKAKWKARAGVSSDLACSLVLGVDCARVKKYSDAKFACDIVE